MMEEVSVIEESDERGVQWKTRYYKMEGVYTRVYKPTYADKAAKVTEFDAFMKEVVDMFEAELSGKAAVTVLEEVLAKTGDVQQPLNGYAVFKKDKGTIRIGYSVRRRKAALVGYQSVISGLIYIAKTS